MKDEMIDIIEKNILFHKYNNLWREKKLINCFFSFCRILFYIYNLYGLYLYNISIWLLKILCKYF